MELLCTTCKRRQGADLRHRGMRCRHCKTPTLVSARQYDADVARLLSWSKATEQPRGVGAQPRASGSPRGER